MIVEYETGRPTEVGVYACRVEVGDPGMGLYEDRFLFWHENKWWYPSSDAQYRGPVYYWIGPLRRQML